MASVVLGTCSCLGDLVSRKMLGSIILCICSSQNVRWWPGLWDAVNNIFVHNAAVKTPCSY